MNQYKQLITPFGQSAKWTFYALLAATFAVMLLFWQVTTTSGLIPKPVAVFNSFLSIVTTKDFVQNLFCSVLLTVKAMLISIVIALAVGYLSVIPVFQPLARFIVKCRYLTISGLYFVFILIAADADKLKLSLLVFGIVPFFVTSLLAVITNIRQEEFDSCRTLRYNNWQTLYEVIILGRMDQIFEIIRQNFAITWIMIVTVEASSLSGGGIGAMLYRFNKYNDLKNVLALQIVILLIGILTDSLLVTMRRELFPYTKLTAKE
ncbi:ABC transporter permease [Chitinophagaceae bacterium MMS25-I14]